MVLSSIIMPTRTRLIMAPRSQFRGEPWGISSGGTCGALLRRGLEGVGANSVTGLFSGLSGEESWGS